VDRQAIQFRGRRSVIKSADRLGRHSHGIHFSQTDAAAGNSAYDFVYVHRFERTVALAHTHCGPDFKFAGRDGGTKEIPESASAGLCADMTFSSVERAQDLRRSKEEGRQSERPTGGLPSEVLAHAALLLRVSPAGLRACELSSFALSSYWP
jgi:hypothetical protein